MCCKQFHSSQGEHFQNEWQNQWQYLMVSPGPAHHSFFHSTTLLGCTCPALRPKKEPRVSNKDICGLMGAGAYTSEARSWSDTPQRAAVDGGQDMAAGFAPRGKRRLPVTGRITSGWLIIYQGNQRRGTPLTSRLLRVTGWSLGRVCRKVTWGSRC